MSGQFQPKPGHPKELTKVAEAIFKQAQDSGLQQFESEGVLRPHVGTDARGEIELKLQEMQQAAEGQPQEPIVSDLLQYRQENPNAQRQHEVPAYDPSTGAPSVPQAEEAAPAPESHDRGTTDQDPPAPVDTPAGPVVGEDAIIQMGDGSQMSVAELAEGHLKGADYTKKTMELSAQRKAIQQQVSAVTEDYQQRSLQLDQLASQLQHELQTNYSPEAMAQLERTNPGQAALVRQRRQEQQQLVQEARQQQQQLMEYNKQQRIPFEKASLMEADPEFANDFDATYKQVGEYVLDPAGGGLTPDIWNEVYDHRFIKICADAMRYRQMQNQAARQAPRIQEQARRATAIRPGVTQPGKTARDTAVEVQHAAEDRLRQSGSVKDFAAALLARNQARSLG